MKITKIFFVLMTLVSFSALAEGIKITYFSKVNSGEVRDASAEVCGMVTGNDVENRMIEVVPSYNRNIARRYYTHSGRDGIFCQVIAAFSGRVSVQLINNGLVEANAKAALK